MLKKLAFASVLAILILGLAFLVPESVKEFPSAIRLPSLNIFHPKEIPETKIILTGDIMLGRSVMQVSLSKNDPSYPFGNVFEVLQKADIAFGNLETPIIEGCPSENSGMIFCADPKMLTGLKLAGIDIVNIANNHTQNYGESGFTQTENFLTNEGIGFVGANNLIIKEVSGVKFGFLGFNFVDKKPEVSDLQYVKDSKARVDVLIVMVHWGNEYTPDPTPNQKESAEALIKNGADVIVGGHPHWVQGIDTIDGKPIFYSLGNFIFDQAWSENTKKGLVIRLTYQKDKLSKIEELPTYMENFAQPKWVNQ